MHVNILTLQIGYGLCQIQSNTKARQMDVLEGIRKTLIENLDDESPSPLIQVFLEIHWISLDLNKVKILSVANRSCSC